MEYILHFKMTFFHLSEKLQLLVFEEVNGIMAIFLLWQNESELYIKTKEK